MVAGIISFSRKFRPIKQGLQRIILTHGWTCRHVGTSRLHLSFHKTWQIRKIMIHTHIHNIKISANMTSQHINGSSTAEHVVYHLGCHLCRKCRNTFSSDPVVRSKTAYFLFGQHRVQRSSCQNIFQGNLFKSPQTSLRFGKIIKMSLRRPDKQAISRLNTIQKLLQLSIHKFFINKLSTTPSHNREPVLPEQLVQHFMKIKKNGNAFSGKNITIRRKAHSHKISRDLLI